MLQIICKNPLLLDFWKQSKRLKLTKQISTPFNNIMKQNTHPSLEIGDPTQPD
jgi:hypothetical protein